ncbi:hypothetical protein R6L23_01040 [Streptomyces sp. SR27]|uniref:hypothetical protein n=1 Tax=Streptomyces sp. SR27 TaxID=3076630 RepID=UPI00295C2A64|nr:hypothetical protein [Streptomyces sp. SR27]MDV9186833.1 hypothetical protein [Streptomyces sp. SR27]
MIEKGVHEISPGEVIEIREEATGARIPVLEISTSGEVDKVAFFDAVGESIPLSPPLGPIRNWDGLSDSMWNGIYEMKSPRVVIIWADSQPTAAASGDFYVELVTFKELVGTLGDPRYTQGRPVELSVYLAAPSAAAGS